MKVSASRLDNECEELQIYGNSDTVSSYPSLHPYYSPTDNEVPTFALPSNLENFSGEYSPKNIVPSTKRGTPLQFEKGRTDLRNLSETAFRNSNGALTYGDERKVPKSHTSGRVCCWIRWTRKRFIIFSLVTLLLSLTISLLVYFVFLPRAIRSAVQNGLGSSNLNLTTASVGGFTQKSVQLSLLASITAPMPGIQIPVHIDPFSISAKLIGGSGDLANQQPLLVNLALESPVDFKLGDAVVLNNTIQIDFSDSDNQALSDLVAQLSSEQGLSAGQKILAEMNINIKVAGIPLYSNFNLPVTIELSPMKGGGGLPTFIKADGVLNSQISKLHPPGDLISISPDFPSMHLQNVSVSTADQDAGPLVKVGLQLENPTKLSLFDLSNLDAGIQINGVNIARVNISGIILQQGLITIPATAKIHFDDASISGQGISKMIVSTLNSALLGNSSSSNGLVVNLVGPIKLEGSPFVEAITQKLSIPLPVETFQQALLNCATDAFKSENSGGAEFDIKSILVNSSSVSVVLDGHDTVTVPLTIALPRLLPLSSSNNFTVDASFRASVKMGGETVLGFETTRPISLQFANDRMFFSTQLSLSPTATDQGAQAIIGYVDSLLHQENVGLTIANVSLMSAINNTQSVNFGWSTRLLGGVTFPFTIPASLFSRSNTTVNAPLSSSSKSTGIAGGEGGEKIIDVQNFKFNGLTTSSLFDLQLGLKNPLPISLDIGSLDVNIGDGAFDLSSGGKNVKVLGFQRRATGTAAHINDSTSTSSIDIQASYSVHALIQMLSNFGSVVNAVVNASPTDLDNLVHVSFLSSDNRKPISWINNWIKNALPFAAKTVNSLYLK